MQPSILSLRRLIWRLWILSDKIFHTFVCMKNYLLFILIFFPCTLFSQSTNGEFCFKIDLKNGIYSTYQEVLKNNPKYPDCVLRVQHARLDTVFYNYVDKNSRVHDYEDAVFAIVNNNILYIRNHGGFYKVIIRGPISIINREVYLTYFNGITDAENQIFIVDFETGEILKFKTYILEEILKRDRELFTEFSKLSNSKKKNSLYSYILRYNERNPILIK